MRNAVLPLVAPAAATVLFVEGLRFIPAFRVAVPRINTPPYNLDGITEQDRNTFWNILCLVESGCEIVAEALKNLLREQGMVHSN